MTLQNKIRKEFSAEILLSLKFGAIYVFTTLNANCANLLVRKRQRKLVVCYYLLMGNNYIVLGDEREVNYHGIFILDLHKCTVLVSSS